ncbi:MAG: helix-hairpin-helix domain-containing protein [Lachnospiraceae bacterium]|nr:helix-hairpin-helix domain-containing protein [Lachnospiraceae bacterium]
MIKKNHVARYKNQNGGILSRMLLVLLLFGLFGCGRQENFQVALESGASDSYSALDQGDNMSKETEEPQNEEAQNEDQVIYVHVCGAVKKEGVYSCKKGDRVFQLIEAAGGLEEDACPEALNQAQKVEDGTRIYVPTVEEWEQMGKQDLMQSKDQAGDGRININLADESQLCTLPGIGASKARAILSYREEHGFFNSIEEIQSVSGIGSGIYEKIKDSIKVDE